MVAIADPSSTAGRAGLVDQSQFAKARDAIRAACDGLLNPNATQQQVIYIRFDLFITYDSYTLRKKSANILMMWLVGFC